MNILLGAKIGCKHRKTLPKRRAAIAIALIFILGCRESELQKFAHHPNQLVSKTKKRHIYQTSADPACYRERIFQPHLVSSLDVLFVVDTSSSMDEHLNGVAKGIDSFISMLPRNFDYQFAVMPAQEKE